jgi:hypothetical protein
VAAQLALLAADDKHRALHTSGGSGVMLAQLRRSIETDRFGIVAHVLSVRDKCTVENCAALAMFVDARKVRAHLAADPFGVRIQRHTSAWHEQASELGVASQTTAVSQGTEARGAAVRPRNQNNLFYPSSTSIPAISIMAPEPAASQDTSEITSTPQVKSRSRGNGPMRLAPRAQ